MYTTRQYYLTAFEGYYHQFHITLREILIKNYANTQIMVTIKVMNDSKIKYRLKFLFQQIDLRPGTFTIGRSDNCNLTLEDALVSREHAIINITGTTVTIEDQNSRNGTVVNNHRITKVQPLKNGDRIIIGKQNLVFLADTSFKRTQKKTGAMIKCPNCKVPMVEGPDFCPICGYPMKKKYKQ